MLTLQGEGVPAAKIRAPYELLEEPQILEREIETPTPCLGEHNEKVLCGLLGIKKEDLAELVAKSVISDEKTPREPRNRQILREEWGKKGGIDMKELIKVFEAPTKNTLLGTGTRSILSKKVGFWTVVLLSTLSISTGVLAQDTSYVKEGVYVGVTIPFNTISGDFDGQSALVSATEIIVIPKAESNMGFGALLGVRFKKGALELSYLRSEHDDTSVLGKGTTVYNIVDIDFKIYPSVESQMQPYLLFGMGIPWLVVRDGAFTATAIGDATLRGFGFNIGGGISYYLQPTICVNGGVIYRWISYSTATGVSGVSNTIQDGLGGSGLTLKGGITFAF